MWAHSCKRRFKREQCDKLTRSRCATAVVLRARHRIQTIIATRTRADNVGGAGEWLCRERTDPSGEASRTGVDLLANSTIRNSMI